MSPHLAGFRLDFQLGCGPLTPTTGVSPAASPPAHSASPAARPPPGGGTCPALASRHPRPPIVSRSRASASARAARGSPTAAFATLTVRLAGRGSRQKEPRKKEARRRSGAAKGKEGTGKGGKGGKGMRRTNSSSGEVPNRRRELGVASARYMLMNCAMRGASEVFGPLPCGLEGDNGSNRARVSTGSARAGREAGRVRRVWVSTSAERERKRRAWVCAHSRRFQMRRSPALPSTSVDFMEANG